MKTINFMGDKVDILKATYVKQTFSKHMHEEYALGVIESGAMGFRYRGAELVASKGLINLVVPGEVHDGHALEENGWRYRMFYLPPDLLLKAASEISLRPEYPHFKAGVLNDPEFAADILNIHKRICSSSSPLENESLLLKMLIKWISRHADHKGRLGKTGNEHRAVEQAREYMNDCFAEDINLEMLCGLSGLSYFHFIRIFEQVTGMTPHAYLLQIRVSRARNMLASRMRLADIAQSCGFYDQSHLTRCFRKQFGVTPGKYRTFIQNKPAAFI